MHQSTFLGRPLKALLATVVLLVLPGCTTLQGAPKNVLDEDTSGLIVAGPTTVTTREEIITHYVSLSAAQQKAFRNRVSAHYMGLIDKNYEHYSTRLFNEGTEVALGFDTAIIGLSATAALFEEAAHDLATVIAGYAGVRAAIDKNLYFDRTLPALITTMDTERTRVETVILRSKDLETDDYPIEAAIRDLRRYQHAGTLMRAVTAVNVTASEEKTLAQAEYEAALPYACDNPENLTDALTPLSNAIHGTFAAAVGGDDRAVQRARTIAHLFEVPDLHRSPSVLRIEVLNAYDSKICNLEQINAMKQKITATTGLQL